MGMNARKRNLLLQTLVLAIILVMLNVISRNIYSYLDLTEDKRFTLTKGTERLLEKIPETLTIDVLLDGDMAAGFKRLQTRTEEVIKQLRSVNPRIEYSFRDPSVGTVKEINQVRENLAKDGIYPTNLTVMDGDKRIEKLIYPYAIVKYGSRKVPINLLEEGRRGEDNEIILNRSANDLEYKFARAIDKLFKERTPEIWITTGNGELIESQTATFESLISSTIVTQRVNLDSIYIIPNNVDALIVARPQKSLSEKAKFIIDQYIMNGGQVVWVIEQFHVNVDSINVNQVYVPKPIEHGLDDMFFKYGVRLKTDLVLDLENSKIPQVIGRIGDKSQQELFPWFYYPLAQSSGEHPIVHNIDRVLTRFPSSIELLEDREGREKNILLTTSRYSRYQVYPMRLSFEIIRMEVKPEAYNKGPLPIAGIIEGEFESFYKNRVTEKMHAGLKELGTEFKERSVSTRQIFMTDSDIMKNLYDPSSDRISPLGFNRWENMAYKGNQEFMTNLVDYLTDDFGLYESRTKNLQLRLLDPVKLREDSLKWQMLNIGLPILLVILSGLIFGWLRKRRYA